MPGLLDSLIGLATPQIVNALASRLGENESAVKGGLQSGFATILGALASKSSDSNTMGQIFGLLTGPSSNGILGNISSLATSGPSGAVSDMGQKLLGLLLGGEAGPANAAKAVAQASGLSATSASGILSMAAPLVMGFLGNKVKTDGLNIASLGSLLTAELPAISGLIPAGLASITGIGSGLAAVASAAAGGSGVSSIPLNRPALATDDAPAAAASSGNWLIPLLLAAAALAGLFYFFSLGGSGNAVPADKQVAAKPAVTAPVTTAAKGLLDALGEFFKRKLPNGIELNIPQLGVENKLIAFIEDTTKPVDKTTWFNFDRLLFDTGKATLQASSQEQLSNIAAILKAYPAVELKLGGYTDNVGDKAMNKKLSTDRANTVMAELAKLGVDAKRLTAEGYGDEHPVASNDTEEGRQQNRRIAMRVTKK